MKSLQIVPILAAFLCGQAFSQEVTTPPTTTVAAIPEPTHDDTLSENSAPIDKPDFQIESTLIKLIEVVESPPMTGLPPAEGTMKLTVHTVADPKLPALPSPAVASNQPGAEADTAEEVTETLFANVSATVYDRSRTLLVCHPMDGGEPVTAWSNVDFNHFGVISTFEAKGADGQARNYHLMMGIGNEDSAQLAEDPEAPQIPTLPDGAPAFRIITENPNSSAVNLVEDLHALYRTEGARMAADVAAREQEYEDQKAYLLVNPPKPKDVTVHFWKRDTAAETQTPEGSQP